METGGNRCCGGGNGGNGRSGGSFRWEVGDNTEGGGSRSNTMNVWKRYKGSYIMFII